MRIMLTFCPSSTGFIETWIQLGRSLHHARKANEDPTIIGMA
jgi:hypothetical protein